LEPICICSGLFGGPQSLLYQLYVSLESILNILIITISFTGEGPIGLLQRISLLLFQLWIVYILLNKEIGII